MNRFPGVDYIDFDSLLTDEQRLVRDTVRASGSTTRSCRSSRSATARGASRCELVPEMGEMNLFGSTLTGYGLPGLDNVAYGLIMQELERGDSGLRSFVSVQSGARHVPDLRLRLRRRRRTRWLPQLATGEAIGCFGLTEPDFGSNPGGMRDARQEAPPTAGS